MEIRLENPKNKNIVTIVRIDIPESTNHVEILVAAKRDMNNNLNTSVKWQVFKDEVYIGDASKETIYDISTGKVIKYESSASADSRVTFYTREKAEEALRIKSVDAEKRLDFIEKSLNELQNSLDFSIESKQSCCVGGGVESVVIMDGCKFRRKIR